MSELPHYKFWVGSYCNTQTGYPDGVNFISDVITIREDLGNQIPESSWMLYLLEFYADKMRNIPVELNLICSFNDNGQFVAIFGGHNQHPFKILPVVGHSYVREITLDQSKRNIIYRLHDLNSGESESFPLSANNMNGNGSASNQVKVKNDLIKKINKIKFEGAGHATCLEWHNRKDNSPFPIRYQVEISLLQYGKHDSTDATHDSLLPYNSLTPYKDDTGKDYPVMFRDVGVKKNCICYTIDSGKCQDGMTYSIT